MLRQHATNRIPIRTGLITLMTRCALAALLAPAFVPAAHAASPPGDSPFSELPFPAARDAAIAEHRLFVVDATSAHSAPSRRMERDTWLAAPVVAWLTEHAIAVRLDVEEQVDLAQELGIEAAPTILLMRGETELDRQTVALDAGDLLAWMADEEAGHDGTGPLLVRALKLMHGTDIDARLDIARQLVRHGETELALQHYLWLWSNTRDSDDFEDTRLNSLLVEMKALADGDDDARDAFAKLYAKLQAEVVGTSEPDPMTWAEFTSWCLAFGRVDDLVAWYDTHHAEPGGLKLPDGWDAPLVDALIARQRWAEAGRFDILPRMVTRGFQGFAEAQAHAIERETQLGMVQRPGTVRDARVAAYRGSMNEYLRGMMTGYCTAAWAAGDDSAGRQTAERLLGVLDDAPTRLALVSVTLKAVGLRPEQSAWLDEAGTKGADPDEIAELRERIAAAVAAAPPPSTEPVPPASAPEPFR